MNNNSFYKKKGYTSLRTDLAMINLKTILNKHGVDMDDSYIRTLIEEASYYVREYAMAYDELAVAQSRNMELDYNEKEVLTGKIEQCKPAILKFVNDEHFIYTLAAARNLSLKLGDKINKLENVTSGLYGRVRSHGRYSEALDKALVYDVCKAGKEYNEHLKTLRELRGLVEAKVNKARFRAGRANLVIKKHQIDKDKIDSAIVFMECDAGLRYKSEDLNNWTYIKEYVTKVEDVQEEMGRGSRRVRQEKERII